MNKKDLALNDFQWLIYHKTKPNQTKSIHHYNLSLPAGRPNYILCLLRADINKFLLVSPH